MIISILVIAFIFILLWIGSKGPARSFNQLKSYLIDLDERGYNYSTLVINRIFSKKFIQFRKLIINKDEINIQLAFPNANWSKNYYPQIIELAINDNLDYKIVEENHYGEMEFIYINCNRDIDLAHSLIEKILLKYLKNLGIVNFMHY